MITDDGPKVVEFNARFGDPETQVVLPLLESDLVKIMLACVDGTLADLDIAWSHGAAVCVVMASGGYPKSYQKALPLTAWKRPKLRVRWYSMPAQLRKTARSSQAAAVFSAS